MLAKIGFCFAVGCHGYARLARAPILDAILGTDPLLGRWVGGLEGSPLTGKDNHHEVVLLGEYGQGKMLEPAVIYNDIQKFLTGAL